MVRHAESSDAPKTAHQGAPCYAFFFTAKAAVFLIFTILNLMLPHSCEGTHTSLVTRINDLPAGRHLGAPHRIIRRTENDATVSPGYDGLGLSRTGITMDSTAFNSVDCISDFLNWYKSLS